MSDPNVRSAGVVMSVINLLVIAGGIYSCKRKISAFPQRFCTIFMFYSFAIACLLSADVYFLSFIVYDDPVRCTYFIVETLAAVLFLASVYAYLSQSLDGLILRAEFTHDEREKRSLVKRHRVLLTLFYSMIGLLISVYVFAISFDCYESNRQNNEGLDDSIVAR
jgi:hypothetical protein